MSELLTKYMKLAVMQAMVEYVKERPITVTPERMSMISKHVYNSILNSQSLTMLQIDIDTAIDNTMQSLLTDTEWSE